MPNPKRTSVGYATRRSLFRVFTLDLNSLNDVFSRIEERLDSVGATGQRPDMLGQTIVNLGAGSGAGDSVSYDQLFGDFFLGDSGIIYFGSNPPVEGDWRLIRSGNNLNTERFESGSWTRKEAATP